MHSFTPLSGDVHSLPSTQDLKRTGLMTPRLAAAASLLALSLAASASPASAQDTRAINVWGAHIEVPTSRPGGVFGGLSPDGAAPSDQNSAGLNAGRATYTSGSRAGQAARTRAPAQ